MLKVTPQELIIIKKILAEHVPHFKVWVFGSRVTGTNKKFSDLDLAIISDKPLTMLVMANLKNAFSDSDLPYKVDVVDWATTSDTFREIIKKDYEIIEL